MQPHFFSKYGIITEKSIENNLTWLRKSTVGEKHHNRVHTHSQSANTKKKNLFLKIFFLSHFTAASTSMMVTTAAWGRKKIKQVIPDAGWSKHLSQGHSHLSPWGQGGAQQQECGGGGGVWDQPFSLTVGFAVSLWGGITWKKHTPTHKHTVTTAASKKCMHVSAWDPYN